MELPVNVKITSHRPVIGPLIVIYKKLIGMFVAPYLKSVFEKEHQLMEAKLEREQQLMGARMEVMEGRITKALTLLNEESNRELIRRMDTIASLLNQRQEELERKGAEFEKKLEEGYRDTAR